ncbi:Crp/Fnr family transcriptional regulator [Actinomadura sp. 7K507]|uniref:Crp/Fnr family transcriptional regulator n=1 Tax=Actinomadura sp. 7K507 TaxID=2530365 RepID=UPI00104D012F|nr:Crp/Fnr family transcriptional regulator [Actinomadura sp. 7K507]TDC83519.1 Crp/Fnr family transcriptional regulator [Actinomadura sp. 7K507]
MTGSGWHDHSFLGRLSPPARDNVLRLGRPRTVGPDKPIMRQGEPGAAVYVLLDGRVGVERLVENGALSLLGIRHAGDLVGEMAVINDDVRTATVTTLDRCILSVIPAQPFMACLTRYPEAMLALSRMTGDRLTQANIYRADAAGYEVDVRLARALLYQAGRSPGREAGHPTVKLRQKQLAMLIGAQEGTVQKALRGPSMRDLVACGRGRVVLLDVPALARLAEMEPPPELRR